MPFQHISRYFLLTISLQRGCSKGSPVTITQASQSQCLHQVLSCINSRAHLHIQMPHTLDGRQRAAMNFYLISRFPRMLDAIDCTQVALQPPRRIAHIFCNRHPWHSINVQAVSDASGRFIDVHAVLPGSTHDSFVYCMSPLARRMAAGEFGNMWLLGKYQALKIRDMCN